MKKTISIFSAIVLLVSAAQARELFRSVAPLSVETLKGVREMNKGRRESALLKLAENNQDRPQLKKPRGTDTKIMINIIKNNKKKRDQNKSFIVYKSSPIDETQKALLEKYIKYNRLKKQLTKELDESKKQLQSLAEKNSELLEQADTLNWALRDPVGYAASQDPLYKAGLLAFQRPDEKMDGSVTGFEVESIATPEKVLNKRGYKVANRLFKPSLKAKKILFLSIHGTFSDDLSFGYDETRLTTQALYESVKKLAVGHNKAVDFATFSWSGQLHASHRKEAAEVLAEYVNKRRSDDPSIEEVVVFSHSHGCNVVLFAASMLNQPIDTAFLAACPDTEVHFQEPAYDKAKQYQKDTFNIKTILHCWGLEDVTQAAGSAESQWSLKRKLPLRINQDHRVYNICLKADGCELNHIDIKYHLAKHMHELMFCAKSQYPNYFDLNANVFDHKNEKPLMALRHAEQTDALEKRLSEENKALFKTAYNSQFDDKASKFWRIASALKNEFLAAGKRY